MRDLIAATREVQKTRFKNTGILTNSEMGPQQIQKYCTLTSDAEELTGKIVTGYHLSGRGYHKLLKLARTIADLQECEQITHSHIAEAASYRIQQEVA
jgi:magnesium chelatase family protein